MGINRPSLFDRLPVGIDAGLDISYERFISNRLEEVGKAPLSFEVLFDGKTLSGRFGMDNLAVYVLLQGPDAGLYRQLADLNGLLRVVIPSCRAGGERQDELRPLKFSGLLYLLICLFPALPKL